MSVIDPGVINLFLVTGAAGAFFLVLKWVTDGKLHTDSEVTGLRQDKADLLSLNKAQADALKRSNELLSKALERRE